MYRTTQGDGERREVAALEPDERRRVLEAVDGGHTFRVRFTVRTLMHTGMRVAELAHMDETWLDGPDPTAEGFEWGEADSWPLIRVAGHKPCTCTYCEKQARRNVSRHSEMPDEGEPGFDTAVAEKLAGYWKPKSAAGDRNIPVYYPETWALIWEYFHERGDVGRPYEYPDGTVAREVGVTKHALWSRVKKVAGDVELEGGYELVPHALRHTFGTMFAENEAPVDTIRQMMGHSSNEATQVYIDLTGEQVAQQGAKYAPDI